MTHASAALVLGLTLGTLPAMAPAGEPARTWRFSVLLNGRPIGTHEFTVTREGDQSVVESNAHFVVRLAFVTVYRYEHHDHEVWQGGCLQSLDSRTNDNGKSYTVTARRQGDRLTVTTARGVESLSDCVMTFAYWDENFLKQTRLLNSQTGEYQPVRVNREDTPGASANGQGGAENHYALTASGLALNVWYSPASEWLGLESQLSNGRRLRYVLQ